VIATTSEVPAVSQDDVCTDQPTPAGDDVTGRPQLVEQFCVVRYVNHVEPVHSFLARHLRRRLIAQSHLNTASTTAGGGAGSGAVCCAASSDLARVVDWLPRVWHKVNQFLDVICPPQLDITIGNTARTVARSLSRSLHVT